MKEFVKIAESDNVLVALRTLKANSTINVGEISILLKSEIPVAHKFALKKIRKGEKVLKYGAPIGIATLDIEAGEYVHVHNTKTGLSGTSEYSFQQKLNSLQYTKRNLTFKGYRRTNGDVGIRNELWIVPTVGCVNGQAEQIIKFFKRNNIADDIDGIEVFKHNYGCSQLGDDHSNTQKALASLINHPNAGAVFVLGLGCENNQVKDLKKLLGNIDEKRIKFLVAQDVEDEIEVGQNLIQELYEEMRYDQRETCPLSDLKIGLKCGGSDGFSGITANPLVGVFSDFLIAQGGTTILTEVPEMFGAEHLLMERAENEDVFKKTVNLINGFKEYYLKHDLPVYENPSPGNKDGGITTLEDKSLGCTQKGGQATVVDVLEYAQPISKKGLNLLASPGNDLVAASALGFSGCQMLLFTTGRGTPFGSFIPTMKISTNTALSERKKHWIDFNAGGLAETQSMEEILEKFIQYIIQIASGQELNHEKTGFKEISIFKTGITL